MNIKDVLLSLHERPVAFYPIYARKTKSLTCGVLLSQLLHWNTAMKGEPFFKTDAEIREETALSIDELKSAKGRLKTFDFVEIKAKGVPAKTWYTFDLNKLAEWISTNQLAEIPPTEKRETRQQESGKPANSIAEIPPTLHRIPENTTKNTTEREPPPIQSANYLSETKPFDPEPTAEKSELIFLNASKKIKEHFRNYPDDWTLICDVAKKKLSPARFAEELDKWLSRNVENLMLMQNPSARLKRGESSFVSWIAKPWVTEVEQNQNQNQRHGNGNSATEQRYNANQATVAAIIEKDLREAGMLDQLGKFRN